MNTVRYNADVSGYTKEETDKLIKALKEKLQKYIVALATEAAEKLEEEISSILGGDCNISEIGNGSYGRAFRVDVDDKAYVIKTFLPDVPSLYGKHGQVPEVAHAVCLSSYMKPSQCVKFYFGKFAKNDEHDGYMFMEYVDPTKAKRSIKADDIRYSVSKFVFSDANDEN